MEGISLDNVLNDEPSNEPVAEAVEPQAPEPVAEAQPRDATGKFAPKGEKGESPAPVEEPEFDHAAVKGERARRQAAEAERERLREEVEALKQQFQQLQKEPPAPPPSMWDDEQGWQQHFGQQVASAAVQQSTYLSKLQTSEIIARQSHEDFAEVWEPMNAFLAENPALAQKVAADAHPWGAAYKAFKNHRTMQEIGATDLTDLEAKIEARIRERLATEQTPTPQPNLPQSLADAQSSKAATAAPARLTLEDILGR